MGVNKQIEWRRPDEIIRPAEREKRGERERERVLQVRGREKTHKDEGGNEYLSEGISRRGANTV